MPHCLQTPRMLNFENGLFFTNFADIPFRRWLRLAWMALDFANFFRELFPRFLRVLIECAIPHLVVFFGNFEIKKIRPFECDKIVGDLKKETWKCFYQRNQTKLKRNQFVGPTKPNETIKKESFFERNRNRPVNRVIILIPARGGVFSIQKQWKSGEV